jgi:hypothetical protein
MGPRERDASRRPLYACSIGNGSAIFPVLFAGVAGSSKASNVV